jgi:hypothetical protein
LYEVKDVTRAGSGLVNGMNGILAKTGCEGEKRFCDASGGALDFGIAFITPEKEQELALNELIWRSEEYVSAFQRIVLVK